jgi:hypothetical protein
MEEKENAPIEKKIKNTLTEWRKQDLIMKAQKALLPKKPLNFEEEKRRHNWMLKNEHLYMDNPKKDETEKGTL